MHTNIYTAYVKYSYMAQKTEKNAEYISMWNPEI